MTEIKHARDIPDEAVIELVRACVEARCEGDETWGWHGGRQGYGYNPSAPAEPHWANRFDIARALGLGSDKEKVLLAKLKRLIKRGLITGCACGCRGDFELP